MADHRLSIRVYYEDTDFSGVVYHASYLRFLERGRTEMLRTAGVSQADLKDEAGQPIAFAVRHMTIDFARSAMMDDVLDVWTAVKQLGGASLVIEQRILRDVATLLSAEVKVALVRAGRPCRLPARLRERLQP
jgi:acyl-CoA thioester hydrolase